MRKLLCKLFYKFNWVHQFKKTGANQYGSWHNCVFCGKRYYVPHIHRLIGIPKQAKFPAPCFIETITNIKLIDSEEVAYNYNK